MPLTDEQSKQAYDRTLQPEEEQPKYWDVDYDITIHRTMLSYGTRDDAKAKVKEILSALLPYMFNGNEFDYEITEITEQEGE